MSCRLLQINCEKIKVHLILLKSRFSPNQQCLDAFQGCRSLNKKLRYKKINSIIISFGMPLRNPYDLHYTV